MRCGPGSENTCSAGTGRLVLRNSHRPPPPPFVALEGRGGRLLGTPAARLLPSAPGDPRNNDLSNRSPLCQSTLTPAPTSAGLPCIGCIITGLRKDSLLGLANSIPPVLFTSESRDWLTALPSSGRSHAIGGRGPAPAGLVKVRVSSSSHGDTGPAGSGDRLEAASRFVLSRYGASVSLCRGSAGPAGPCL